MISIYKDFDNPPKDLLGDTPKITTAVKQALYDLYHGKCAFTEEKLTFEEMVVTHYRPVSLYPELEFEWSNLLPVSKNVNISLSNKFPIDGKQVEKDLLLILENRKADSACLLAERPLLLHPEVDTPENHLTVSFRSPFIDGYTKKGRTTVELLYKDINFLLGKVHNHLHNIIDPIIQDLSNTVSLKYNLNEESFTDNSYQSIIEPYFKKFYALFQSNKEFSLLSKSYVEQELSSFVRKDLSKEKYNIAQIIYLKYVYSSPNSPTIQDEWHKNIHGGLFRLNIRNFHSIKRLDISNLPIAKWIFLTGENGAGKSLLLQAISISFFNKTPAILNLNENTRIETLIYSSLSDIIITSNYYINNNKDFLQIKQGGGISEFAAYGPSRLSIKEAYTEQETEEEKLYSIFQKSNTLENIESYLAQIYDRASFKERYKNIKKVLLELLPTIKDIQVDTSSVEKKVSYIERTTTGLSNSLSFRQLSSGNQSIIAMIGDMIIRLIKFQNNDNPCDLEGIVLIDEIDIHLHPNWQKKFVQTLTKLFPKIQFIASTHSPIPLLGAPKETVILNVEKPSSREGIKVKRLDIDVTELTPNTILTSPIFGFEGIISDAHDSDEPLYTDETYNDVLFEKHLDRKLEEFEKTSEVDLDDLLNPKRND